ncbi:MAG: hypothetical protein QW837_09385, partial [Conexivisphaerales archaeon]
MDYILRNATCFKCAHMATCLVFRDEQQIAAQFPPTEDGVTLRDARLDRIVEVKVRKGELVCDLDNSNNCIHVGF